MEIITVSVLEAGKFPAIRDSFKRKYKVSDITAFEVGKSYEIEYTQEPYQWEGKTAYSKKIISAKLAQAPTPVAGTPPTNGNGGKYTPDEKEAFAKKDLWMARECALKCSVEMVKAHVEMAKNDALNPIEALSSIQSRYYTEFLAEITK